jgi:uncharacterized protein (DUF1800 family)
MNVNATILMGSPNSRYGRCWGRLTLLVVTAMLAACGGGNTGAGTTVGANSSSGAAVSDGAAPTSAEAQRAILEEQAGESARAQTVGALASTGTAAAVAPPSVMSEATTVRFLNQATFGSTEAMTAEAQPLWRYGWMQKQFAMPITSTHFQVVDARNLAAANNNAGEYVFERHLWESYLTAPDQLRKRVGYALSQIFVINIEPLGGNGGARSSKAAAFFDILERNAFGNFRTLLDEVSTSPAMGTYLTFAGNKKALYPGNDSTKEPLRVPDENYAREIMQLFTIGLYQLNQDGSLKLDAKGQAQETYDTTDVQGLARVFTGWNYSSTNNPGWATARMNFSAANHSPEEKAFLGVTIPAGTGGPASLKTALDTLFNHPNVGPFIGKQLIQRLVTSNPSPAYVSRVAARFDNNGSGVRGDMKAVLDAVLRDKEARDPGANYVAGLAKWGKLREPVLRFTTFARAFGVSDSSADGWTIRDLSDPATTLGQSPVRSPSVFNFYRPGYVPPNTSLASNKLVAPEFQITTETSIPGYVNFMSRQLSNGIGSVTYNFGAEAALAGDPAALVDRLNRRLTSSSMSQGTRDAIIAAVTAMPVSTAAQKLDRARQAILLTVISPEYLVDK